MLRKDIDKEKEVVQCMIELYCRGNHNPQKNRLCVQCQELSDYALKRLDLCPFGNSNLSAVTVRYIATRKTCVFASGM